MTLCELCPRRCKVNRDEKIGFCGVSNNLKVAKACLHYWEEPIISGQSGSGTIFFSGCTLKCVFCQNYEVSRGFGKDITTVRFVEIMKELEGLGAVNINLVTPTHYVSQIISALDKYKPNIPIVYNTSGYESVDTIKQLEGYVDVYLPDFKYSDNALAKKYSKCPDYFEKTAAAILEMKKQVGEDIIKDNLLKRGIIVRHLVLPNAIDNSLGVINWIKNNLPKESYISLMGQFVPYGEGKNFPELNRVLKPLEYKLAINKLLEAGFTNAFVQELDSASQNYIPDFNLQGV